MKNPFQRFRSEFARYLRNGQFEETSAGIRFPKAGAFAGGALLVADQRRGTIEEVAMEANLLLRQGLNHMLDVTLVPAGGYAQITKWYYAPFSANYTPNPAHTAADLPAASNEFTEYTAATRLEVSVPNRAADGVAGASGITATMEVKPGGPYNVYGVNIVSGQAKGSTSGVALASIPFARPRLELGADATSADKLGFGYRMSLRDEG